MSINLNAQYAARATDSLKTATTGEFNRASDAAAYIVEQYLLQGFQLMHITPIEAVLYKRAADGSRAMIKINGTQPQMAPIAALLVGHTLELARQGKLPLHNVSAEIDKLARSVVNNANRIPHHSAAAARAAVRAVFPLS